MCIKNVGSILRKNYNLEEILRKPINYDISFLNSPPTPASNMCLLGYCKHWFKSFFYYFDSCTILVKLLFWVEMSQSIKRGQYYHVDLLQELNNIQYAKCLRHKSSKKIVQESTRVHSHNLGVANGFLDITPKKHKQLKIN